MALALLASCAGRGAPKSNTPPSDWGAECLGIPVEQWSASANSCERPDPKPAFDQRDGSDHRLSRCEQTEETPQGPRVTMRSIVEEITLEEGTRVVLHNGGCDYFNVRLMFQLPDDQTPVNDASAWRVKAAQLLRDTLAVADLPMSVNYGVAADQLEAAKGLDFMEEMEVTSTFDIPTTVMLEGASTLPGREGRSLRLRLSTGPLSGVAE
ncbi:MAG: hypothetical protein H6740_08235 [Alphaproteobacteria bacterium]|nr:hypothetical protein [Alphaproteobacteria bacterium]